MSGISDFELERRHQVETLIWIAAKWGWLSAGRRPEEFRGPIVKWDGVNGGPRIVGIETQPGGSLR